MRDFVAGTVFNISCIPAAVKERGQEYCDFATIAFTLLIAGVIGGIFVTDDVVAATQTRMRLFEDAQTHTLRQDQRALMRAMYKAYLRSKNVGRGMTVWNFPRTIWRSVGAAYDLYIVAGHRLPLFYFVMIPLRFGSAFPKGLYGLLALVLFEGLLASQVAKAFFEYYPACRS